MYFNCSWSKSVWLATLGMYGLLFFEIALFTSIAITDQSHSKVGILVAVGVTFVCLALLLLPLFFAPREYVVKEDAITIIRLGKDVHILTDSIVSISLLSDDDIGRVTRVNGIGGLYGFFGMFQSNKLGMFRALMTQTQPFVLLSLKDGSKIGLSPDQGEVFTDYVNEVIRPRKRL